MAGPIGKAVVCAFAALVFTVVLTVAGPGPVQATPTVNIPAGATYSYTGACATGICVTDSYLDDTSWNASNVTGNVNSAPRVLNPRIPYPGGNLFLQGFNAWNSVQATAWNPIVDGTMNGTNDLGGSFDVTRFQTAANCNGGTNGQVCINVNTNNLTGLPVPGPNTQIVWAQALFDDYKLDGAITAPFFEMDVMTPCGGAITCPPAYPFQTAAHSFFDAPSAPNPNGFFAAEAFIGTVNYTTRTLTLYDGIDYGFINDATPEPSTLVLLAPAIAGWGGVAWRRRAKAGRAA